MHRNQRGFTIVELMIALVVSLVLVTGTYSVFLIQNRSADVQNQVVGMQQNGRIAMQVLVSEIRRGAYDNPVNPAGAQVSVDSNSPDRITIQKDTNDDGTIQDDPVSPNDDEEWIVFRLNANNQLEKVIVHQADESDAEIEILADQVDFVSFTPLGGNVVGTVTTNPRSVLVNLNVRTTKEDPVWTDITNGVNLSGNAADGLARTRNYQKRVWVRNLNL